MATWTLSLLSLISRTRRLASSLSMPCFKATVWRTALPEAFSGVLNSSAAASTLRRVRCILSSSCICLSLRSSSASTVSAPSSRLIEQALPLKSKRLAISRLIPATLLALAARGTAQHAGDEIIRERVIAMHVEAEIDAGLGHLLAHQEGLRTALEAGFLPLAIEIGARSVGAQIAAPAAIRIHVRYDMEDGPFQQLARH